MNKITLFRKIWNRTNELLRYVLNKYIKGIRIRKPPIFIVGCGHSGTSLLLRILGSHSKIYAVPYESWLFFLSKSKQRRRLNRFNILAISEGKSTWVEKTPKHIRCMDRILDICPDARILLIIRDGRDVARSLQIRDGSIELGIKRWIEDNRAGESFWKHPNVYILRYEQLIENFEKTVRDIINFLDETYENEMHEYHKTPRCYYSDKIEKPQDASVQNHKQHRNWQINQPLFDGRGKWLQLTDQEKQVIKNHANEMLIKYGYVHSADW